MTIDRKIRPSTDPEQQKIVWETDDPEFTLVKIPKAALEILIQRILFMSESWL